MSIREASSWYGVVRRALLGSARFVARALIGPIVRWERRQATIRTLSSLDDRMLADIGLWRSEIRQVVDGRMPRRAEAPIAASATESARQSTEPVPEMRRAA
jgi:uncharacterized protein YjiS (DUF1127 family)